MHNLEHDAKRGKYSDTYAKEKDYISEDQDADRLSEWNQA
jgi:hypothetical protein